MYKIYTLSCPIEGRIKYVGMTKKQLHVRLIGHLNETENINKEKWISGLLKKGMIPIIEEIDSSFYRDCALYLENYWISQLKQWNMELVNIVNNTSISEINKYKRKSDEKNVGLNLTRFKSTSMDLVQKLVQIRKSIPMTQASMADWLGVDRRKIIDLENGKMNVSLMLCYAEKLSVDIKLKFKVN